VSATATGHLLYIWTPTGYRLQEREGPPPAIGETIGKIGQSAILLLPLVVEFGSANLPIAIPLFVLLAAKPVWDYAMGQLEDRRGDSQAAISGRLALLGNHVAAEFEREVRQRLTDLHTWQEQAVRVTAGRLAEERIGWKEGVG